MCFWRLLGWEKAFEHREQMNGFSPLCTFIWMRKILALGNDWLQCVQLLGFSPVWVFKWTFNVFNWVNISGHWEHLKGVSSACDLRCSRSSIIWEKDSIHRKHLKAFTVMWLLLWFCKRSSLVKDFGHWRQLNGLSTGCFFTCFCR
jgi:hypothetical protein